MGVLLNVKYQGGPAPSSGLKEIGTNHDILLHNDSFTFLNAELNDKKLVKHKHLKRLTIPPQRLEIQ
jgi:hypothetical protein